MNVFVAGGSAQLEDCRRIISLVKDMGFYCFDWTDGFEAEDESIDPEIAHKVALRDLKELCASDVLVWMADIETRGALFESGAFTGIGIVERALGAIRISGRNLCLDAVLGRFLGRKYAASPRRCLILSEEKIDPRDIYATMCDRTFDSLLTFDSLGIKDKLRGYERSFKGKVEF